MKEGIDVTGIPGPNPMLGCGIILFVVGVVAVIAISGYLLFNTSIILQMLFYDIFAIVVGIILIVLCLKRETELQMEHKAQVQVRSSPIQVNNVLNYQNYEHFREIIG